MLAQRKQLLTKALKLMKQKDSNIVRSSTDSKKFFSWAIKGQPIPPKTSRLFQQRCTQKVTTAELQSKLETLWQVRLDMQLEFQISAEKRHFPLDDSCSKEERKNAKMLMNDYYEISGMGETLANQKKFFEGVLTWLQEQE